MGEPFRFIKEPTPIVIYRASYYIDSPRVGIVIKPHIRNPVSESCYIRRVSREGFRIVSLLVS